MKSELTGTPQTDDHLLRVLTKLNRVSTAKEAGSVILEAADQLLGWDAAVLNLYTPETDRIGVVLTVDTIEGERTDCVPAYDQASPSPIAKRVLTEGPLLIRRDQSTTYETETRMFGDLRRRSACLLFVPIRENDKSIGLLSVQSYQLDAYDQNDLDALQLLADYCAGALNRIRAETERRTSEERFRIVSKATSDAIWDWDLIRDLVWWNEGFEKIFGFKRTELDPSSKSWTQHIHPEDLNRVMRGIHKVIAGSGADWEGEYRFACKDGSYAYVLDRGYVIRDSDGKAIRMVGGMTDFTSRKQVQDRLVEQATLLDAAREAILVKDMDERILYWNNGAERTYGWSTIEAVGKRAVELLRTDPDKFDDAHRQLMECGEWQGEQVQFAKSGKELMIEVRWTLLRDKRGDPKSILAINTDITERKKLEQHVLHSQRMESIGTLASGMAHDLNNIFAPILMSTHLLRDSAPDEDTRSLIATLEGSAQRGADLVRQVLTFARGVDGRRVPVDVSLVLRDLSQVVKDTFPKNISIRWETIPELWTIIGDSTQLHQVLLNLCVNARDAMPEGGTLQIAAQNVNRAGRHAAHNTSTPDQPHVLVTVTDTGKGIPPEIRHRIFEPFFTTKEVGKGTGLGLSTSSSIVRSLGGFIHFTSEVGKGTKFEVYLPAKAGTVTPEKIPTRAPLPKGNGELILVVDDEESIRAIANSILTRSGYRVLLACNGEDALEQFHETREKIAIVLTDMAMPVMDGPALIRILKQIAPALPIIASSGASSRYMLDAESLEVVDFIAKPYTAERLLNSLKAALESSQQSP